MSVSLSVSLTHSVVKLFMLNENSINSHIDHQEKIYVHVFRLSFISSLPIE